MFDVWIEWRREGEDEDEALLNDAGEGEREHREETVLYIQKYHYSSLHPVYYRNSPRRLALLSYMVLGTSLLDFAFGSRFLLVLLLLGISFSCKKSNFDTNERIITVYDQLMEQSVVVAKKLVNKYLYSHQLDPSKNYDDFPVFSFLQDHKIIDKIDKHFPLLRPWLILSPSSKQSITLLGINFLGINHLFFSPTQELVSFTKELPNTVYQCEIVHTRRFCTHMQRKTLVMIFFFFSGNTERADLIVWRGNSCEG